MNELRPIQIAGGVIPLNKEQASILLKELGYKNYKICRKAAKQALQEQKR